LRQPSLKLNDRPDYRVEMIVHEKSVCEVGGFLPSPGSTKYINGPRSHRRKLVGADRQIGCRRKEEIGGSGSILSRRSIFGVVCCPCRPKSVLSGRPLLSKFLVNERSGEASAD